MKNEAKRAELIEKGMDVMSKESKLCPPDGGSSYLEDFSFSTVIEKIVDLCLVNEPDEGGVENIYQSEQYKEIGACSDYIGSANYYNGAEDHADEKIWVFTDDNIDELTRRLIVLNSIETDLTFTKRSLCDEGFIDCPKSKKNQCVTNCHKCNRSLGSVLGVIHCADAPHTNEKEGEG